MNYISHVRLLHSFPQKLLLFTLCIAHLIAHASQDSQGNIRESFFYGSFGGIFPAIPTFGLGYRYQHNHVGMDLSLDTTPLILVNILRVSPAILFYPKPYDSSEGYIGFSCGGLFLNHADVGRDTWSNYCFWVPELVVGYQYKRSSGKNNFFECRLGAAIKQRDYGKYSPHNEQYACCGRSLDQRPIIIPCASIKFGFGF